MNGERPRCISMKNNVNSSKGNKLLNYLNDFIRQNTQKSEIASVRIVKNTFLLFVHKLM